MDSKSWMGAVLLSMAGAASAHLAGGSYGVIDYTRIDASEGRLWRVSSWKDNNFTDGYSDVWAATIAGRRYAFLGQHQSPAEALGVEIVDVTEPDNLIKRGYWKDNTSPPAYNIKDVQVNNAGWGFASSDQGGGAYIIDIRSPGSPGTLHRIYPGKNCNSTPGIECDGDVHNVWANGDYLYLMHWKSADVRIFRWAVSGVPQTPQYIRTVTVMFGADYYGVHDLSVKNGRMMLSCTMKLVKAGNQYDMAADQGANGGRTFLYDLSGTLKSGSSTSNPLQITSIATGVGTHSNWMTDNGVYIYSAREAEGAGIKILKISGSTVSEIPGIMPAAAGVTDPKAVPHNPVVKGNNLYVTWYTEGLKVFDITNPEVPTLIGSFDVHQGPIIPTPGAKPNQDINCYRGIWGVDPFLGENSILISDLETGLHTLHLTPNIVPTVLVPAVIQ